MTKRKVLKLSIIIMGITGAILIVLGKSRDPRFAQIGYFLLYSICALMVLDHKYWRYNSWEYRAE